MLKVDNWREFKKGTVCKDVGGIVQYLYKARMGLLPPLGLRAKRMVWFIRSYLEMLKKGAVSSVGHTSLSQTSRKGGGGVNTRMWLSNLPSVFCQGVPLPKPSWKPEDRKLFNVAAQRPGHRAGEEGLRSRPGASCTVASGKGGQKWEVRVPFLHQFCCSSQRVGELWDPRGCLSHKDMGYHPAEESRTPSWDSHSGLFLIQK